MLEGARLAVVVPAHNEERLLAKTLTTMPSFVDDVVVVDDASTDRTFEVARSHSGRRVRVHRHAANRGVGAAIVTGYHLAVAGGAYAIAVMAGDAQMHPDDLAGLALPVVRGEIDYAKGDRFSHPEASRVIPVERSIAGRVLSSLTRRAAGLDALSDSQCGYTVISAGAARLIDLDAVFPRYGYPNDLLGKIAGAGLRIRDVPVRPVYGDETSGVRPWHVAVILGIIARIAWERRSRTASAARSDYDASRHTKRLTLDEESSLWCGPPKEDAHVGERPLRDAVSR
jgi:glycosyltransferase involved in cell wall biosynthesis